MLAVASLVIRRGRIYRRRHAADRHRLLPPARLQSPVGFGIATVVSSQCSIAAPYYRCMPGLPRACRRRTGFRESGRLCQRVPQLTFGRSENTMPTPTPVVAQSVCSVSFTVGGVAPDLIAAKARARVARCSAAGENEASRVFFLFRIDTRSSAAIREMPSSPCPASLFAGSHLAGRESPVKSRSVMPLRSRSGGHTLPRWCFSAVLPRICASSRCAGRHWSAARASNRSRRPVLRHGTSIRRPSAEHDGTVRHDADPVFMTT